VRLPCLVRPLVVEAVEDRRAARLDRGGRIAVRKRRLERARVDEQALAVERDPLAGRDDVCGGRPERPAQLGQRCAQARARRLVEHVGPEPRGELRARVRARAQREVGEHAARAAGRRRRQLAAAGAEPETAGETHLQHAPTVVDGEVAAQPFTHRERCANGGRGRSPPWPSRAVATSACWPPRPASPRSATSSPCSR